LQYRVAAKHAPVDVVAVYRRVEKVTTLLLVACFEAVKLMEHAHVGLYYALIVLVFKKDGSGSVIHKSSYYAVGKIHCLNLLVQSLDISFEKLASCFFAEIAAYGIEEQGAFIGVGRGFVRKTAHILQKEFVVVLVFLIEQQIVNPKHVDKQLCRFFFGRILYFVEFALDV